MLEKIRLVFIIITFVCGAFVIIIPAIKENSRQNNVSELDINNYIEGSQSILLDNIELLSKQRHIIYADPVMTNRYSKRKNTLLIKDNSSDKYYQIESYDSRVRINPGGDIKDKIYLIVNAENNKDRGSVDKPIIALRYYLEPEYSTYYIKDHLYQLGVKEYLTYRDYTPLGGTTKTILGIIGVIFVLGIVITSVMIAKQAR